MKKHRYCITANSVSKKHDHYLFNYGKTNNIELFMSSGGFSIKVEMGRLYTISEILQSGTYLFADAIKKAFLIYLLKYSNSLKVNSIKVRIDDNEEHIECEKRRNPVLFSLINGNLVREVPISFSGEAVIHRLLNTPKSKYDSLISALFAFVEYVL